MVRTMLKYVVVFISAGFAVWRAPEWVSEAESRVSGWLWETAEPVRLIRQQELSLYTGGRNSNGLYLSVLGQVFDVEKGRRHYGPDGGYHFFTGISPALDSV